MEEGEEEVSCVSRVMCERMCDLTATTISGIFFM